MRDAGVGGVDRFQLPPPQVAGRRLPGLGGPPGDEPALGELDDVVLPDLAVREGHGEDLAGGPDPLAGGRLGEVVVAVPAGLPRRVGEVPSGEVWVHCAGGYRASIAASVLAADGRRVVAVDDSFEHVADAGLPVVTG